ncbi:hypothetical protein V5D56_05095 [Cellulosimicrobium sp. PMB13]|uniref:hypothetical protein n=1 Tax=Cellulosimicrobium sp. PMB13 TaxID=3120158 RepID=UPI003F4C12F1
MTSPGSGRLRAARGLVLAAVVVGLSLLSHELAGGSRPDVVPLVVLAALSAVAVRPLTRREVGLPRLLALLGAGQVVLHVVLERSAELSPTATASAHAHDGPAATMTMLAAHAVATVVVALVLRHGDAVLWRLWTWLTRRRVPEAPRAVVVPVRPLPRRVLPSVRRAPVPGAVGGRAPPASA